MQIGPNLSSAGIAVTLNFITSMATALMTPHFSKQEFDPAQVSNWMGEEHSRIAALLPGLKHPDAEVRTRAVHAYRGAFGQIGIQSEDALLAVGALINDPDPETRKVTRQTLIEVNSYRSALPALPILIQALRTCTEVEEAKDIGRAIGCVQISPADEKSHFADLAPLLDHESDSVCVGAARAVGIAIQKTRLTLNGLAERFGIFTRENAETRPGTEIIARIGSIDNEESERLRHAYGIDAQSLQADYTALLTALPALAKQLLSSNWGVRESAADAVKGFNADCREIFSTLTKLASDFNHEVRTSAFEAMACCPKELGSTGDMIVQLLCEERHVLAVAALTKCVANHPLPPAQAVTILKVLAGLPPNEDELQKQQIRAVLVVGNDYVASQAMKALERLAQRESSN